MKTERKKVENIREKIKENETYQMKRQKGKKFINITEKSKGKTEQNSNIYTKWRLKDKRKADGSSITPHIRQKDIEEQKKNQILFWKSLLSRMV